MWNRGRSKPAVKVCTEMAGRSMERCLLRSTPAMTNPESRLFCDDGRRRCRLTSSFPFHSALKTTVAALLAYVFVGCARQPTTTTEMEQEFNAEFGFPPDSSVRNYRCSVSSIGDSLSTWFSFECSEDTFQKLHETGYQSAHPGDRIDPMPVWQRDIDSRNPNAPVWWPRVPGSAVIFWKE